MRDDTLRKAARAAGKEIEPEENDSYVEYYEDQGATPAACDQITKSAILNENISQTNGGSKR